MMWLAAAAGYCIAYLGAVTLAGGDPHLRLWIADAGLLLSPFVPLVIVCARWRDWNGRARIYWSVLAAGCALWVAGHVGWSVSELLEDQPLPWLEWPVALKLTGAVMPIIGLIAWPHAQIRGGSLATIVLDIAGVTLVSAFLFWSLIVAPGLAPYAAALGLRSLVVIATLLHVAIVGSFAGAAAAARRGPWRSGYLRLALGAGVGSLFLITNARPMAMGTYATGSLGDIGWIVPFWCFAWAAWEAPASPAPEVHAAVHWADAPTLSPLLFVPVLIPIVGYGPRFIAPLGTSIDRLCDVVTSLTLTGALGLTLVRVAVEQRARHRADYRVWLLATACEQSSDLIVIIRLSAIEYANRAFQRAFGYSLDELRLLPPEQLAAPESRDAIDALVAALRGREIGRGRLTLRRRDGSTFEAACTVAPMSSASGRTAYFVGVVRDLSDDLREQDQIVAHERLSAIQDIAAGVAHEISNPLQSVLGLAELMLLRGDLALEARADADHMRHEVDRACQIIRKLQVFVRRDPVDRQPVDLNAAARKAVAMRSSKLTAKGIRVDDRCAPQLPAVLATDDEMEHLVWQLAVNAEEAMARGGGGGVLTLRTTVEPSASAVVLEVADDGPGISPHAVGRIFEPFFSTKPVGQGLGLSIAFGIVAAHGGSLELVPTARGACFRVTLPIAQTQGART